MIFECSKDGSQEKDPTASASYQGLMPDKNTELSKSSLGRWKSVVISKCGLTLWEKKRITFSVVVVGDNVRRAIGMYGMGTRDAIGEGNDPVNTESYTRIPTKELFSAVENLVTYPG